MLGPLFIISLLLYICLAAFSRPHIGVIGYYGFALLQPQWNWRWSLPDGVDYQKFIAGATLVGLLTTGLQGNPFRKTLGAGVWQLVGFLALAAVSAMSSVAPAATAFYLDLLWKIVLMTVVAVRVIDTKEKALALLWVLVISQGYNAYQINLQYFQDGFSIWANRGFGSGGDNNIYSNLTVPLIAGSLALAVHAESTWRRFLAAGIAVLQLHQLMLLESRGAMLGAGVLVVLFVMRMPKTRESVIAAIILGASVTVLAGPPVVKEFSSAFESREDLDSSAASRYDLWAAGLAITQDYPLLGVGPYAGQYLVPKYYPGGLDNSVKGLHNLLFEISTGCGIPALLLYIGFFAVAIRSAHFVLRDKGESSVQSCVALAVFCGLIGYGVASMFSSAALLESSYALAALGLCLPALAAQEAEEPA